jgi:flagellar hook protein FlgE
MFGSIFTSLTGLLGFSRGLDVLSHNITNLNTPGFKGEELQFRDLFYRYGFGGGNNSDISGFQLGQGLDTKATRTRFQQGELRQTGNPADLAIDGNGFFILRKNGETFYSRAGQFEFAQDGFLVEKVSGARVAALQGSGGMQDVSIAGLRSNPPQATTEIKFIGNLSRGSASHVLNAVSVNDAVNGTHPLQITFTDNSSVAAGSWTVEIKDADDDVVATGEIRYQGNGSPETGFNTLTFNFSPSGAPPMEITLNFGEPGDFSSSTSFSGGSTSDLSVSSQNGFGAGSLTRVTFDGKGVLTISYSNGQTADHQRLALAWFDNLQDLTQLGDGLFSNSNGQRPTIAAASDSIMGSIVGESVELSNVELTEQFTDMVVIQRGYQASSQVISVANEMMQQLLDIRSRR